MKIIISPFSKKLRDTSNNNPKNYPYWKKLITLLKKEGHEVIQIGITGEEVLTENVQFNLPLQKLKQLLQEVDLYICVDNFFQHFASYYNKQGIVIFSKSDPNIFGYKENINLLKDRKHLRPDQFGLWESCLYDKQAFVTEYQVMSAVKKFKVKKVKKTSNLPEGYLRVE